VDAGSCVCLTIVLIGIAIGVFYLGNARGQGNANDGTRTGPSSGMLPSGAARIGPGRRMRTELDPDGCEELLEEILSTYRERRYVHLPHHVDCGHEWLGEGPPPDRAVCFTDGQDKWLLLTVRRQGSGSELGLFRLGGDERETPPVIGHWKMRDQSLLSIGSIPAGSVAITAPRIPADLAEDLVRSAGYPLTAANVAAAATMLEQQFLLKAHQFINSQEPGYADEFVARHRSTGLQEIVRDLAAWNTIVLPYVQDLPWRIRALMLEPATMGQSPFWRDMDQP
jgi:hypothetical protein